MPLPESLLAASLADFDLQVVAGAWPEGLRGEMFVSVPVVDDRLDYQLFGFGAMARLSLEPGTHGAPEAMFAFRGRVLDTPVRRIHDLVSESFSGGVLGLESPFGHANMVNTAPLAWNGRMFATWDVGRPAEVDPVGLSFLGEVGSSDSWGGDSFGQTRVLPQIFSTAHPIVDPERGCMWTVKLSPTANGLEPTVVQWDGSGTRVRTWPLPGAGVWGSMHTISQTRNWLVLADSGNFKADMGEVFGGERTSTIDQRVPVYFVRKDSLESTRPGEPVTWERGEFGPTTGHYYAVWDDSDGVRVLFEHLDLTDLGYRLFASDVDAHGSPINPRHAGFYNMAMRSQTVSEVVFTPGRGTTVASRTIAAANDGEMWNLQLSAMDWSIEGLSAPTHHHVVFQGRKPQMLARRVLDIYAGRAPEDEIAGSETGARLVTFERGTLRQSAEHRFAALDDLPSSPIFVPRAGGTPGGGDGWVVVPVLSDSGFRVECFDAARVGSGPVAVLRGAGCEQVPFLLHAVWSETCVADAGLERLSFADEISSPVASAAMSRLDDRLRDAVLEVAGR